MKRAAVLAFAIALVSWRLFYACNGAEQKPPAPASQPTAPAATTPAQASPAQTAQPKFMPPTKAAPVFRPQ